MTVLAVSERRACQVVGQCRATQQYVPQRRDDEGALRTRIVELARAYGRYGYLRITALLHQEGWRVNHKRVERIWREEGLKVPQKQPKRARLWLANGSCVRRRPAYPNHVWAYDFVMERTHDGRSLKMLTVVDEYSRECLAIEVRRRLRAADVTGRAERAVPDSWLPDAHPIGQWPGVHRHGAPALVGSARHCPAVH
jgi:transposase InsO family protein